MSEAIAITIVQRENGLQHVKKMLEVGESEVKRTAICLIRNLSHYQELHFNISKHLPFGFHLEEMLLVLNVSFICSPKVNELLPELVEMLPSDDTGIDLPTEVTASLCHILNDLSQSDSQHAGDILSEGALPKIIGISSKDNGSVRSHTLFKKEARNH